jgi:hypothetical protein
MTTEPVFSINAAAKLTGYSLPTVRKRLPSLIEHGAKQVEGKWKIPLSALHGAGLMMRVTSNDDSQDSGNGLHSATTSDIETLRARLAEAEQRAAVAEALADERQRALDRADLAMRMLEARAAPVAPQTGAGERRGLFSWLGR